MAAGSPAKPFDLMDQDNMRVKREAREPECCQDHESCEAAE